MNTFDNRLYHKAAISSQEGYDLSGLQQIVQNGIFCRNNKRNIGKRISKVVQE